MAETFDTGMVLYSYEITLTPTRDGPGVGLKRIVTVDNLPHSDHEAFQQKLLDALLNFGIKISEYAITHKLKSKYRAS